MKFLQRLIALKGKLILLSIGLVTVIGCTPALVVHQDFDPTANFGQHRTYHWYTTEVAGLEHQLDNRERIGRSVKLAVESALLQRGMSPTTESPDVLVAYYVSVGGQQGLDSDNASSIGYGFTGIPNFKDTNAYSAGTLVIDLVQANSNELIWRGWAEAEINPDSLVEADITRAVNYILAQYPPGVPQR